MNCRTRILFTLIILGIDILAITACTRIVPSIKGSGSYNAEQLRSQKAIVDLTSNGSVTLWVEGTLDVRISSSGNVRYYGSPAVTTDITSSGRVIQLGDR
jgi:hypothetical protein